ncbi:hypothetical protein L227DRAFT_37 [Lentinus tigrinus ALCF2SS1-6]|uniref:Uncharacterized protein n=1 Tax=Lentinus tigrinus ALCF2SS1-6 TaxID=1328759 RepID=A0A5C2SS20_9APHY|nr:hypothetical protein L227DRAFT_37 [Lentinus tigrinus ALCF2SS1-6]
MMRSDVTSGETMSCLYTRPILYIRPWKLCMASARRTSLYRLIRSIVEVSAAHCYRTLIAYRTRPTSARYPRKISPTSRTTVRFLPSTSSPSSLPPIVPSFFPGCAGPLPFSAPPISSPPGEAAKGAVVVATSTEVAVVGTVEAAISGMVAATTARRTISRSTSSHLTATAITSLTSHISLTSRSAAAGAGNSHITITGTSTMTSPLPSEVAVAALEAAPVEEVIITDQLPMEVMATKEAGTAVVVVAEVAAVGTVVAVAAATTKAAVTTSKVVATAATTRVVAIAQEAATVRLAASIKVVVTEVATPIRREVTTKVATTREGTAAAMADTVRLHRTIMVRTTIGGMAAAEVTRAAVITTAGEDEVVVSVELHPWTGPA